MIFVDKKSMSYPTVTLIVVPNQSFSNTKNSLESIYKYTNIPFKLIYIDGNSPQKVKQYLEIQSQEKGFRLIRTENYLSPNKARNIGLKYVDTEYVVFLNNDVSVTAGWLNHLMRCAEETGASAVSPLCLQTVLEQQIIHFAGGTLEFEYKDGKMELLDKQLFINNSFARVKSFLRRKSTQIIDFNCVLVRKSIFKLIGNLDENLMSVGQEIDFSLSVFAVGRTIYFEPASIVNYASMTSLEYSDTPYCFLRWNYAWNRKSINHFQEKWGLSKDAKFLTKLFEYANSQIKYLPLKSLKSSVNPLETNKETSIDSRICQFS